MTYEEARDLALKAETADKDSKQLWEGNNVGSSSSTVIGTGKTIAHMGRHNSSNSGSRTRSGTGSLRTRTQQPPGDHKPPCHRCRGKHDP